MEVLVRVKQKEVNGICDICTREDCPLFENTKKNERYYRACDNVFMLNYSDTEEQFWCGECECHVSDFLCLRCANERIDSLLSMLP